MKLPTSGVIWFNGEFVPWDQARVHVLSHALHYASAVFEGLRAYATPGGPAVVGLGPHVERLFRSCRIAHLPLEWGREEIAEAILETLRRNGHPDGYLRPLVFRGYGQLGVDPSACPVEVAIATWPHGSHYGSRAIEEGIDVGVSSWRRIAPDTLPAMAKSAANYMNSQMVLLEAKRHGYADGIALDVDGYACESSGANLFLALDGVLYTPPLDASILPGITRAFVLQLASDLGLPLLERRIAREMLYMAEEVFLTGTAAEITPVKSVDGLPVGGGERGELTARLQREFFGVVRGESEDRHGWMTLAAPRAPRAAS